MNNTRGIRFICVNGMSLFIPENAIFDSGLMSTEDRDKRIKMAWNDRYIDVDYNVIEMFNLHVDLTKLKGSEHLIKAIESEELLKSVIYIMADKDVYVFKPGVVTEDGINHGLSYKIIGNRVLIGLNLNYGNKRVVIESEPKKKSNEYTKKDKK